ncbi:hypothetical protein Bpfe_027512 [Biomphalaria pfeifferi]|uniref:Uncharacterized protein n=1 Tax=Biomphalaria pfeifferi TaxID=112525 RepID=A0AAD8AV86_BIOPF|nr:hypothetical protein Bpfe_027512 [Biomphalaria pfeifferi]
MVQTTKPLFYVLSLPKMSLTLLNGGLIEASPAVIYPTLTGFDMVALTFCFFHRLWTSFKEVFSSWSLMFCL